MERRTKHGLLIEYEYCTGCYTCQVACAQEHGWPEGLAGIHVIQSVQPRPRGKPCLAYVPMPTVLCNLCANRTRQGLLPACVTHCMARCMTYGPIDVLATELTKAGRRVLWAPP